MTAQAKRIVVVVRTTDEARVHEALRAALGLGLRGAHVTVLAATNRLHAVRDARLFRAVATLREVGQTVMDPADSDWTLLRAADAVEVWT